MRKVKLTAREEQVVVLRNQNLLNKEIAKELGISEGTVKIHVRSAIVKGFAASRNRAAETSINGVEILRIILNSNNRREMLKRVRLLFIDQGSETESDLEWATKKIGECE